MVQSSVVALDRPRFCDIAHAIVTKHAVEAILSAALSLIHHFRVMAAYPETSLQGIPPELQLKIADHLAQIHTEECLFRHRVQSNLAIWENEGVEPLLMVNKNFSVLLSSMYHHTLRLRVTPVTKSQQSALFSLAQTYREEVRSVLTTNDL